MKTKSIIALEMNRFSLIQHSTQFNTLILPSAARMIGKYLCFKQRIISIFRNIPKSSESQVDVSVPVTLVANVDADSVDVLIVVSAFDDATDVPITITCRFFVVVFFSVKYEQNDC